MAGCVGVWVRGRACVQGRLTTVQCKCWGATGVPLGRGGFCHAAMTGRVHPSTWGAQNPPGERLTADWQNTWNLGRPPSKREVDARQITRDGRASGRGGLTGCRAFSPSPCAADRNCRPVRPQLGWSTCCCCCWWRPDGGRRVMNAGFAVMEEAMAPCDAVRCGALCCGALEV
jgi:hypothetical protein